MARGWDRRRVLQAIGMTSADALARHAVGQTAWRGAAQRPLGGGKGPRTINAMALEPFVDVLPLPERQTAQGVRSDEGLGAVDAPYYAVSIKQIKAKMHRDLPETTLWSYGSSAAPVLWEARKGQGVLIDWMNHLPERHILALGTPMAGMEHAPETRTVAHMHGAHVPSVSDGYPEDWFGPGGHKLCFYPNQQDACALWAHDHAMGVSQLNVIAGLMAWYLLRDEEEDALGLPSGRYEVPLLLYDRSFTPAGELYYPNPPDEGAWAQEFLGDAIVVNGKVQPYLEVEPRRYRFRIANAANSRFFSVGLSDGSSFSAIGSDQGLLSAPIVTSRLVLGPSERTDLIVDFGRLAGERINLVSDSLEIMQFRVGKGAPVDSSRVPRTLRTIGRVPESEAIKTRFMTLNEFDGDNGEAMVMLLNRKHWNDPVTEIVQLNTTEIWSFANLTQDVHPIHLHMVRFQILDRQTLSVDDYLDDETIRYTGPKRPPAAHEMGWKDVVQCPPETVTRIIVSFGGYTGRYLWHCHILEHEANDMMRPYVVEAYAMHP